MAFLTKNEETKKYERLISWGGGGLFKHGGRTNLFKTRVSQSQQLREYSLKYERILKGGVGFSMKRGCKYVAKYRNGV